MLLFCQLTTFSQLPEGTPFIKNYTPSEYKASTDNWAIAQDKRGIMYFGNARGVLEYDGKHWGLIPVSNNSIVRSIAIDKNGIIYVGSVGELGFLSPDSKGELAYHSLLNKLPEEEQEFADVWKTFITSDGVYFQTFDKLIRFSNGKIKIWKPESSFHLSYLVDEKLYIMDREKGLKQLVNNELRLVKNGDLFSNLRIYSLLKYSAKQLLIATREKGLFILSDSVLMAFKSNINENLINDQVYTGVALKYGRFAFGTLKNGVFIINAAGDLVQQINKQSGLQEDIVKYVGVDNQNDLWIALVKGISRAEISLPTDFLNDAQGVKGTTTNIIKNKKSLYIATSLGTFISSGQQFVPVDGITSQTWSLLNFISGKDTILVAASEAGIYQITNGSAKLIQEGFGYFVYQSKSYPSRVFIGMNDGLSSMRYENGGWINEDYLAGIDKEVRSIAEDEKGNLWLGTPYEGLVKITFSHNENKKNDTLITQWKSPYFITGFDTLNGLPSSKYNIPYLFRSKILIATVSGIYQLNERTNKFYCDTVLWKTFKDRQVYRFAPKDSSTIWLFTVPQNTSKETGIAELQSDGTFLWFTKPFGKISESEIHAIYPDENGLTWLGGPDGLVRYDANIKKDFAQPFHALIRNVTFGKDTIFGGSFYEVKDSLNIPTNTQSDFLKPSMNYSANSMLFNYSATNFEDEQKNVFSIYLEGFDKDWSDWSNKTEKEYTNLREGYYTFHVKAKNIYGTESIESTYSFRILPPWYRTTIAYIAYVILFIGFVYGIIRLSIRRLVKAKEKLEETVRERTAEVVSQKHLIEEKHKEITDSINYAERIQRSFLATKELLDENLKDYFVFFQPKDVVSGDFYWASKLKNGQFALVTADSTGHGVPGAIMSLLNITSLEKAIEQSSNPGSILTRARKNIIDRLKKDGSAEGGKDGMDCSLVSFDFANSKFTYAAANNPVWLVRGNEILEFDPDKMPVGKHDRDSVPFSQHEVSLQKGDVVYTLTDGMPDQFGGPKGKKFMYKRLKEFLVSISSLSMPQQKEEIKKALNEWKGELEQVDDVCLIGVRI